MTPGQRLSARQQYRYDVAVKAAQDALKALETDGVTSALDVKKKRHTRRARSILETALKEIGELNSGEDA